MNNNTKISIVIFIALIIGAIGIKIWLYSWHEINNVRTTVIHKDDTTSHHIDSYGTEHAERLTAEGKLEDMQALYKADMDNASKRLQISDNQIESLKAALAEVKGKFKAPVDTSGGVMKVVYVDSFTHWKEKIINDTAYVEYDINVPVNLTEYWKRKTWLGKPVGYIDAYSLNPNVHITNLSNIRITHKEPGRFGIGPYIGVSLNGPSVGIAFTYSLIRF